jgi:phage replication initiation protein
MANRRMMSKSVIETDKFMDMPMSTQCLYFHLLLRADDDGFIASPKRIMRCVGCSDDDIKLLIAKNYVIAFETGIIVIKHWRVHNYIKCDRYKQSNHEEVNRIKLDKNGEYQELDTKWFQNGSVLDTQTRLDKTRLDKTRTQEKDTTSVVSQKKTTKKFVKPNIEEVQAYINEKSYNIDPHCFIDYYESNGWKVGRNSMKDWKATVRNWARNKKTSTLQAKVKADWEKDWSNEKDGWGED